MTFEEIKSYLVSKFGESLIVSENTAQLQPSLTIDLNYFEKLCLFLRDDSKLYFDYLNCLSGVDYSADANEIGVVYHLSSIPYKHSLVLKLMVPINRESAELPKVPSISHIWKTANWHEREAFDLYGIEFTNHPDLRRILCPDDWEGYPLRKDYKAAEKYKGLSIIYDRTDEHK